MSMLLLPLIFMIFSLLRLIIVRDLFFLRRSRGRCGARLLGCGGGSAGVPGRGGGRGRGVAIGTSHFGGGQAATHFSTTRRETKYNEKNLLLSQIKGLLNIQPRI
jgi:hypothetical protein